MDKAQLALHLSALGVIAPHLLSWVIIAILLWLLISSSHHSDA